MYFPEGHGTLLSVSTLLFVLFHFLHLCFECFVSSLSFLFWGSSKFNMVIDNQLIYVVEYLFLKVNSCSLYSGAILDNSFV